MNIKKPKKFWKIIKDMIYDEDVVDITSVIFREQENHKIVNREDVPNFLNNLLLLILHRERANDPQILSMIM